MHTHKGQISPAMVMGIIGVVITLVSLGIVLSTSQKSYATIRDTAAENKQNNVSANALTFTNGTANDLGRLDLVDGSEKVYISGRNSSFGSNPINKGRNYTINYKGGLITPLNETAYDWWNNSVYNMTFSYYYGSSERNITTQGQEGLKVLQDFQPTFGTVFAAFIVITLVIGLAVLVYTKMA